MCLGHQAILAAFGVPIVKATRIVHGKVEKLIHNEKGIFRNIPKDTHVTRYHSLCAKEKNIPKCFEISAKCEDGELMTVEHKEHCLIGVQFHPESIGTKDGEKIIKNFLHYRRKNVPIQNYLQNLVFQKNLSFQDSYDIMDELTEGNLLDAQIGSLLTSLQIKGVTANELAGFASVLKKKAAFFPTVKNNEKRLDTCGTGGSNEAKTFNVSTIVSLIAAAAGAKVVKHGNKAVTSQSGSADLLEKLGININMSPEKSYNVFNKIGLTFLYARKFHGAMRFAATTRSALGFRTLFNLIGPLSNPAHATHQVIGVFDEKYTNILCETLYLLGTKKAMVVHGLDGLDEISLSAPTKITELKNGWIKSYTFSPESVGLNFVPHKQLLGGNVNTNKHICLDIIKGNNSNKANLVYLNTGAALYIYGTAESIEDGYHIAKQTAKSDKIVKLLEDFIKHSNQ